jgi:hypothetical protein
MRAASAAFDGFWLGMFDRETLALLDEIYYQGRTEPLAGRQVTYADKAWNLSGLSDWETAVVATYFGSAHRVVITGAGGGREVLALLEHAFDAVGFEPNERLVEAGRELLEARGHPNRLRPVARDIFPEDAGPCDAVVVGWGSYMLIPGRARRVRFLRDARAVLPEGAPILLSFFTRPEHGRLTAPALRLTNILRRLRGAELAEAGDGLAPNFTHWFVRDEVEGELAAAGFELVRFAEEPYGHAIGRAVAWP